tara:strand:+ start:4780 stop:5121 length:342 start_codon:yes stop_codon:yes gene_type:complete
MYSRINTLLDNYRLISIKYTLKLIKENECNKLLLEILIDIKKEINKDIIQLINKPDNICDLEKKSKQILEIYYIIYNNRRSSVNSYNPESDQNLTELDKQNQNRIKHLFKIIK